MPFTRLPWVISQMGHRKKPFHLAALQGRSTDPVVTSFAFPPLGSMWILGAPMAPKKPALHHSKFPAWKITLSLMGDPTTLIQGK